MQMNCINKRILPASYEGFLTGNAPSDTTQYQA